MRPTVAVVAISVLVGRAYYKKSLTPAGLVAATLTAVAHAYHPWNLPFALLTVFFLAGTRVTHIKEDVKATLTMKSKGTPAGEGPRTHVQVLANSLVASVLCLLHGYQLRKRHAALTHGDTDAGSLCFSWGGDLLIVGIIANYAAVAADTFSSELGILSKGEPRLITSLTLRKVPRGTNGGVSLTGLAAGVFGSVVIITAAIIFLPLCNEESARQLGGGLPWKVVELRQFMGFLVIWGALGSVLDSVLGALFQRSVKDVRTNRIIEGEGGTRALLSTTAVAPGGLKKRAKVESTALHGEGKNSVEQTKPIEHPSRVAESGWDLLDNNDVNFIMAVTMSVSAMGIASWYWKVPMQSIFS